VRSITSGPPADANTAGGFFSLADERLKLGSEQYSPGMLQKIEYAGGNNRSFETAAASLDRLAELSINPRNVERITERLGKERAAARDKSAAAMVARKLRSQYKQAPAMAVISVDAGKAQFREQGKGPGVHTPRWGDTKVACLQTYADVGHTCDPQPDPPKAFVDPVRVERLCREMAQVRGNDGGKQDKPSGDKPPGEKKEPKAKKRKPKKNKPDRPDRRLVRTVVATTQGVEAFGWMVSAEAMSRKFYAAPKRAIVGDGGNWIGPMGDLHFPDWIQILDFLHLLVHLFAAARLAHAGDTREAWTLYEQLLRDAWAGRVQQVLDTLRSQLDRLKGKTSSESRRVMELAISYIERNRQRMDYPRYRQLGLPVGSALVESLIKQVNHRVKGTEQFWTNNGLEAVLQVRAAYLSQDDRAEKHHEHRPRSPAVGRNRTTNRNRQGKFHPA
jgi:hypothetical protein